MQAQKENSSVFDNQQKRVSVSQRGSRHEAYGNSAVEVCDFNWCKSFFVVVMMKTTPWRRRTWSCLPKYFLLFSFVILLVPTESLPDPQCPTKITEQQKTNNVKKHNSKTRTPMDSSNGRTAAIEGIDNGGTYVIPRSPWTLLWSLLAHLHVKDASTVPIDNDSSNYYIDNKNNKRQQQRLFLLRKITAIACIVFMGVNGLTLCFVSNFIMKDVHNIQFHRQDDEPLLCTQILVFNGSLSLGIALVLYLTTYNDWNTILLLPPQLLRWLHFGKDAQDRSQPTNEVPQTPFLTMDGTTSTVAMERVIGISLLPRLLVSIVPILHSLAKQKVLFRRRTQVTQSLAEATTSNNNPTLQTGIMTTTTATTTTTTTTTTTATATTTTLPITPLFLLNTCLTTFASFVGILTTMNHDTMLPEQEDPPKNHLGTAAIKGFVLYSLVQSLYFLTSSNSAARHYFGVDTDRSGRCTCRFVLNIGSCSCCIDRV